MLFIVHPYTSIPKPIMYAFLGYFKIFLHRKIGRLMALACVFCTKSQFIVQFSYIPFLLPDDCFDSETANMHMYAFDIPLCVIDAVVQCESEKRYQHYYSKLFELQEHRTKRVLCIIIIICPAASFTFNENF